MAPRPRLGKLNEPGERQVAWRLLLVILLWLTLAKPMVGIPYLGAGMVTLAAALQFVLPIHRADALGMPLSWIGLSLAGWRRDAKLALILTAVFFPPYALAYHLYVTQAHAWLIDWGLPGLARFIPTGRWAPPVWPHEPSAWLALVLRSGDLLLTHVLGVALPEETFFRGYLQPRLMRKWPARTRLFGVAIGRAAVITTACFALGHFLGEWNPLRLGPFFPGLIFAWLRNASGTVVGAIAFHAACNLWGEVLFRAYVF